MYNWIQRISILSEAILPLQYQLCTFCDETFAGYFYDFFA